MYEIESVLNELDVMLNDDDKISAEHRITIMNAVKLCQGLLAIDQAETNADYNNLVSYLKDEVCEECRDEALVA